MSNSNSLREYRLCKYNPKTRDKCNRNITNEWSSFGDIGKRFDGKTLTLADYLRVEKAYLDAIFHFLKISSVKNLKIFEIEDHHQLCKYDENQLLSSIKLRSAFRDVLRETYWAKFQDDVGNFVHFGYDYYVYLGLDCDLKNSNTISKKYGLFSDLFKSPYKIKA